MAGAELVDSASGSLESDPLLRRHAQAAPPITPLPKLQLAAIYAIKLTLPISHTQMMPYLNVLIAQLAASEGAETGYYSGIVGSAGGVAHLLTIYLWARISDRVGRIPVIIVGTIGIAVSTILFGLSHSFATVLIARFLVGVFSATTGAIHSVVGELTDATNQSIAFPYYDIVAALGFVIGPLIGGTFANPAENFPSLFNTPFWRAYPYLLPCLVTAAGTLAALLLAIFVLEETLHSKRALTKQSDTTPSFADAGSLRDDAPAPSAPLSIAHLLALPAVRAVCLASGALGFAGGGFNSGFVLLAYTPVAQHGLGLSVVRIGYALSAMGAVSIALKLCMPILLRRAGTSNLFAFCMQVWPVTFASMSVLSVIAQRVEAAGGQALEWVAVGTVLFLSRVGCLAFSIIMILTKDHTPGTSSLGSANGLAEFFQSAAGALGPTIISSLFAVSVSKNLLGGYLWVVLMVLFSFIGVWLAKRIKQYRDD
ncbi:MFS general substrate transporter [Obba rivulosa]|uniref:MFS general substrate transporter n=1 Tax=Obba rivulosa TaxID=1052685 RepID=A0A8E2AMP0_9APHY|nr:MFS general substrate transporter [Obba rivulosa]